MAEATDILSISKAFVRLIRDNIFGGEELALIEPFNAPRPPKTHCTVKFLRAQMHQYPVKEWKNSPQGNGELVETIRGTRYCTYRVMFFGTGANQKAVECQNWMRSTLGAEFTLAVITGFGQIGEVQDATTENMAYQEERAFFNVDLYAKFSQSFDWVDTAKVEIGLYRNAIEKITDIEIVNERYRVEDYFYRQGDVCVLRKEIFADVGTKAYYFKQGNTIVVRKSALTGDVDDGKFFAFDANNLNLRKQELEDA